MRKPRILFVAPSAYTLSGLATWLDYMEPGLIEMGWDVTVGLVEGSRHHRPDAYLERHAHQSCTAIVCNSQTHEGRLRAIDRTLEQEQPDIIATVNMPDAILGAARWRQNHHNDLKIVMTVHGIQPDLYGDIAMYCDWIDGVCCTNRLACALAVNQGMMAPDRVHYLPYGIEQVDLSAAREKGANWLTIAWVGRLEQDQKRVHDLPPILSELDRLNVPYHLLIAGTGPEEGSLRSKLKAQLDGGKASFLGFLQPAELQGRVLEQADALLLTSSWETGPLVIWEAMANADAVVSSRYIGSGLEGALVHDENALMFDIGDTAAAAAQLKALWEDKSLLIRLGQGGLDMVNQRYSIPISVSNWDRELRSVLSKSGLNPERELPYYSSRGRMTRLLGERLSETIRDALGLRGPDAGSGGEWPHAHSGKPYHDKAFWALVQKLDQRVSRS